MTLEREQKLAQRLAEVRQQVQALTAEMLGIQTELEALRGGRTDGEPLASLTRSDAICAVLRSSELGLSPTEIRDRLVEAGRADQMNEVTATLTYLLGKGTVKRPRRGRYTAP